MKWKGTLSMLHHILVPLDGSTRAEQALSLASRIARYSGGSLLLLRVVNTTTAVRMFAAEPSTIVRDATTIEPLLMDAVTYLAQIATSSDLNGLKLSVGIVSGTAAECILDTAREQQTEVIVMGSHGYTGPKRWMMGSVAQKVACHSPVPVLIVRDGGYIPSGPYPDQSRPLRPIKALVALDGSARAEATLVPTVHLVGALTAPAQARVHLLRIIPLSPADSGEYNQSRVSSQIYKKEVDEAETYLRILAKHLKETLAPDLKITVTWSVIGASDVAESLICVAEEGEEPVYVGYDIIAMATHGRSGLARWALGSITERVLGTTKLPLFIVRSQDLKDG